MKSILVPFSFICMIFLSCNNKVIPLQQAYQEDPYKFSVSSTKDQVWTKIIDLLNSRGLTIKTIDKSSGLITTDNTSFLNSYAFEDKSGSLTNPAAFVVCTKVRGPFTFTTSIKPNSITGQWTVMARQIDDKTIVDIRLANATGKVIIEDMDAHGQDVTRETHDLIVKSTGTFEKSVEEALNK